MPLPTTPARLALEKFAKWLLDIQDDTEPKLVICLGYNNSSIDDQFLMGSQEEKGGAGNFPFDKKKTTYSLLTCRK